MPTKLTFNCETGEAEEIEMEGDELAAFELQLAAPPPPMPLTLDEMIAHAVAKALATR